MKREVKSLQSVGELDNGLVEKAFLQAQADVLADLIDRPGVDKGRRITLTLEYVPDVADTGELADVGLSVEIKTLMPSRRTREVRMRTQGTERLIYDDLSPDDTRQGTLPIGDTVKKEGE